MSAIQNDGFILPNSKNREWVKCPVCGESDMRKETDGDENSLILCVNHACGSNGGDNFSAVKMENLPPIQEPPERRSYREATQPIFDAQERNRLRDVFAETAMKALIENLTIGEKWIISDVNLRQVAVLAYTVSDAILAEREKGKA